MSDTPETMVQIGDKTVPGSAAPKDRTFRNAWALDGDAIVVDMEKARAIQLSNIRAERAPLLAELDVQYQRADEDGDSEGKAGIRARKQALRDVTKDPRIAKAKTPDELASLTLSVLLA